MELFETIQSRHSIRAFATAPVEPGKLQQILEVANRAPSAGNLQAYKIYVVTSSQRRTLLARAAGDQEFVACAPVVLVFCSHPARSAGRYGNRGETLYAVQDATIACTFAMLAVTALRLASVWVGAFNEDAVREVLGAPEGIRPVAMLPVGYAAEQPGTTTRRPLEDLVHHSS